LVAGLLIGFILFFIWVRDNYYEQKAKSGD
jgi:hypothetical protein